ncbi:MAG: dipeptidyl aminopeptidase/acylaminoacyl peptidase [Flavobacteriales bacterium]|jgi:dipeptidyl aminopeptidase/acylaminoacyl peptidase
MMKLKTLFSTFILSLIPSLIFCINTSAAEDIPVEALFDVDREYSHKLSPKGRKLALLDSKNGTTYLTIVRLPSLKREKTFSLGRGHISELNWISEYRLAYNQSGKISAVNTAGTERLTLVNHVFEEKHRESYSAIRKHRKMWSIRDTLPALPEEILVSGTDKNDYESLYRINVFTGEKADVVNGKKYNIQNWITDRSGSVRLAVRTKKGEVNYFKVKEKEGKFELNEISIEGYDLSFNGESYIDQRVFVNDLSVDKDRIYLRENRNSDKFKIVEYSIEKNGIVKTILEDELVDIDDESGLEPLIFDANTHKLVGVRYQKDTLVSRWFDEDLSAYQKKIDKALPQFKNILVDWNKNRSTVVVYHYSDKDPGRTSVFFPEKNRISMLNEEPSVREGLELATTDFIHYVARDGKKIPAYLTKSQNIDMLAPLIVMPHGGPWSRDYWGYDPYVQYFASRGYNVIQPQFRGSSGFGRSHMLAAKKDLSGVMIDDIADSAKWMISNKLADPSNIFIVGFSYGGYASILSPIRYGDVFKSAVSISSPTDLVSQINYYKKSKYYFAYEYWKTLAGDPKKEKEYLKNSSPISLIDKIDFPLLVVNGDKDEIVNIKQIEKFKKKIKSMNKKNIEVKIIKGEDHNISSMSNKTYLSELIIRFLEKSRS